MCSRSCTSCINSFLCKCMLYLCVQVSASSSSNTCMTLVFFFSINTNTTTQHRLINFSPGTRATTLGPPLQPDSGGNETKIKVRGFKTRSVPQIHIIQSRERTIRHHRSTTAVLASPPL
ncbi:hypothetical protein HanXRQr2_Chr08g0340381 [Helianthus annuus]|uniref:Secreted protein n=1 Tax=Helianthus annuus TaxID=4232 RepID=A0A251U5T4_HELAN|nr:hypothetical protein HanXRQr2_Chr08g0340381 [Helianthus annuus]KAJ0547046.1 hypothetical protein HanIR_Chr08g0367671 [Helianthus annuus]KAJ0719295.1 hypothetical protein HanLR1_Chr08g0280081 [Helianthus annuus]KAJ0722528.1 hypothetical protein HanOQP8_Chr08g0287621 [Helianthus annuus]